MDKRVSLSGEELDLPEIADFYATSEAATLEYFSSMSPAFQLQFAAATPDEVEERSTECLREIDLTGSMCVMAAMEAAIRVDYLSRAYLRKKDPLSRAMRELHDKKQQHASLQDDLLPLWRDFGDVSQKLFGLIIQAMRYRHWLAHGRYWTLKSVAFDFSTVYGLVDALLDVMDAYDAAN
jgi:hypothetical protein